MAEKSASRTVTLAFRAPQICVKPVTRQLAEDIEPFRSIYEHYGPDMATETAEERLNRRPTISFVRFPVRET
jgi:hypothetical protein